MDEVAPAAAVCQQAQVGLVDVVAVVATAFQGVYVVMNEVVAVEVECQVVQVGLDDVVVIVPTAYQF